jgi:hypothetical protein
MSKVTVQVPDDINCTFGPSGTRYMVDERNQIQLEKNSDDYFAILSDHRYAVVHDPEVEEERRVQAELDALSQKTVVEDVGEEVGTTPDEEVSTTPDEEPGQAS